MVGVCLRVKILDNLDSPKNTILVFLTAASDCVHCREFFMSRTKSFKFHLLSVHCKHRVNRLVAFPMFLSKLHWAPLLVACEAWYAPLSWEELGSREVCADWVEFPLYFIILTDLEQTLPLRSHLYLPLSYHANFFSPSAVGTVFVS